MYITYQLGWAGWQVYIMEQSEGSVIKCYYYLTSYHDVCMRCLGDVSRIVCEVTRAFCLSSVVAAVLRETDG